MKHLKLFENFSTLPNELLDFKDLFQEYIDDYNIEYTSAGVSTTGIYYTSFESAYNLYNANQNAVMVRIFTESDSDVSDFKELIKKLKSELIPRLESTGYNLNIINDRTPYSFTIRFMI